MLESQVHARQIRTRLFNPPNGRRSDELEIISGPEFRRRVRQQRDARYRNEVLAAKRREAESIGQAFLDAVDAAAQDAKHRAREQSAATPLNAAKILAAVCRRYGITELDIRSQRRTKGLVMPRHIAMYLCKELTDISYPAIGRRIGGRDHTTVLHGVKKIERLIAEGDNHLAAEIEDIARSLEVV